MTTIVFDLDSKESYRQFLDVKKLPVYAICGREAWFPDEYADRMGIELRIAGDIDYDPHPLAFDYQRDITRIAINKRKFAIFAECGLGKSLMFFDYARAVQTVLGNRKGTLIFTPHMVVGQMADEFEKFYHGEKIEVIKSSDVGQWLKSCGGKIGITNYEALKKDVPRGQLGCLIADESSVMKSHYGNYAQALIELGRGIEWKLCGTGTPAPNDRIEYANHAVFLDQFPTVNSFLATFFVNRGQTQERWVIKKHAIEAFYRSLSHWCIFLTDPSVYGWSDNTEAVPPIRIHIDDVPITESQRASLIQKTGKMFAGSVGGITTRHVLSKIAKGLDGSETNKYEHIRRMVSEWPEQSIIIWCWFDEEQARLEKTFPEAGSIAGKTKMPDRERIIREFKSGERKILISKPKVLGFGLNLQIATRQVFCSLIDSYEQFHQAVKRSNRIGSTEPLDVHIPVMEIERPMIETVLRKADRVEKDARQQERLFRRVQLGETIGNCRELLEAHDE